MIKYKLVKVQGDYNTKLFSITLIGSIDNGDYITTNNTYSESEFDNYVADAIIDLKNNYSGKQELKGFDNKIDYKDEILEIPCKDGEYADTLEDVSVNCLEPDGTLYRVVFQ
jgi:hypothetical protein